MSCALNEKEGDLGNNGGRIMSKIFLSRGWFQLLNEGVQYSSKFKLYLRNVQKIEEEISGCPQGEEI